MKTTRIVLTIPFVRQPPGQVFEVEDTFAIMGWHDDDRVREKIDYSNAKAYVLPDAGNGRPAELALRDTRPCPPEVFEGIDVNVGPCRVTSTLVQSVSTDLKYRIQLRAVNGRAAQAIEVPLDLVPRQATLHDSLRRQVVRKLTKLDRPLVVEMQDLPPGFYRLQIEAGNGADIVIHLFKSFPLMVTFNGPGPSFQTAPTLY